MDGEVFQNATWVQSITQESFQMLHLMGCISARNLQHKIFKSEKVQAALAFVQKHGTKKGKTPGLCFWAAKTNLFFSSKEQPWLYTKRDRMCPDMLCVWIPLFITSNVYSDPCQYNAGSPMQLNGVTAAGVLRPRSHSQ